MTFVGTYEHTIDDNGRVVLPVKFRAQLPETAFVTLGSNCVALMSPEAFEERRRKLGESAGERSVSHKALTALHSRAEEVKPDKQGRFVIPERLRARVGLGGDVVLVGLGDRIEIWDRERWAVAEAAADEALMDALEEGFGL